MYEQFKKRIILASLSLNVIKQAIRYNVLDMLERKRGKCTWRAQKGAALIAKGANMLEGSQYTCAEQFSAYIAGNAAARLVIASTWPFGSSSAEMKAWTRIIAALPVADNDYAFVSQHPKNQDASKMKHATSTVGTPHAEPSYATPMQAQAQHSTQNDSNTVHVQNHNTSLHARQLVHIVEGIDPIALISCDEAFFSQLKAGYAQVPYIEAPKNQFVELIEAMPELKVLAPSLTQSRNPTARDIPICTIYANDQGEYMRLLGRPCIALHNFSAALATQHAKQQVWNLIKHLEPLLSSNT